MMIPNRILIAASIIFVSGIIFGLSVAAWYSRASAGVMITADFIKFLIGLCLVLGYLVYSFTGLGEGGQQS